MSNASLRDLQAALMDAIGPANWRDLNITHATLELPAGTHPRLTLEMNVIDLAAAITTGAEIGSITRRYELVALDEPTPLDLDAMADAAMTRISRQIDSMAAGQLARLREDFTDARTRAFNRAPHASLDIQLRLLDEGARKAMQTEFSNGHAAIMQQVRAYLDRFYSDHPEPRLPRWRRHLLEWFCGHRAGELAATWASVIGIAFVLGGCGRWLDGADQRSEEPSAQQAQQAAEERELAAAWDHQVRELCAAIGGANTGYLADKHDGIVCTDKRGRKIGKVSL